MKPQDPNNPSKKPKKPINEIPGDEFEIKSYGMTELMDKYGWKRKFFKDRLFEADIDTDGRRIFTPKEVEKFVTLFGPPSKIIRF